MLFSRDPTQAWALITRVARLLLPAVAAASVLLAGLAPHIVDIVGGRAYAEAVPVLRILCMMPVCVTAAMLLAQCVMINNGLSKPLVRIYLLVGLINLAVLPGLVWQFAANGAALSLVLAELLGPIFMIRSIARNRGAAKQEVWQ
jgi:O-antigen/teichoic acid export membrane protein